MNDTNIKEEILRIMDDLKEMLVIVREDYKNEQDDRYHVGIMVGIEYVKEEIDHLFNMLEQRK